MKKDWTYKKLGEVCEIINGFAFKSSLFKESGEMILRISNIQNGIINLNDVAYFSINSYKNDLSRYKVYPNDIAIALSGATTGKIGINKTGKELYLNQRVAICREKNEIDHSFLYYYLKTKSAEFLRIAAGVAQPNLSTEEMKTYFVPLPSIIEQQQIVAELDLLSGMIEKQRAQIEELDKLSQSIFYDMFGDPVTNEKGWKVKKLKELSFKITNGNTPKGGSDVYVKEGIQFFRSQNVWRNKIILDDIAYIDDVTHELLHNSSLLHNDILITKTGRFNTENSSLGRAALYTGEDNKANINGHVYLVRLKPEVDKKFVLYILISESYRQLIRRVCVGGIDKRQLNKNHIEDFPIICPSLSLQQEFAAKIEAIEAMKAKVRQSLKESETLFNSRMDYYFN